MLYKKVLCFLTIFQTVSGNSANSVRNSFPLKLVNYITPSSHEYTTVAGNYFDVRSKYKFLTTNDLTMKFLGRAQSRFNDVGTNDTIERSEMEAPAAKFSILNLLSDDEEGEEDNKDNENEEKLKNEEEEENDEIDYFGPEEEIDLDKVEGTKGESFLKQYHRPGLRMHNLVFPLLMAYKLKFFTVIPLLLGALVLLVGTTGIAGFFFALFAAALGINVKSHDQ